MPIRPASTAERPPEELLAVVRALAKRATREDHFTTESENL
jgi:hypothetical protein